MNGSIDYYLSLISPWSYLGHQRLASIARAHGVNINIYPVNLSTIFPSTGGIALAKRAPARQSYRLVELQRWRTKLQINLNLHPKFFPVNDTLAASMVVNLRQDNPLAAIDFAGACLRACWLQDRDISDRDTLLIIAEEQRLDGEKLLVNREETAIIIATDSDRALSQGVFGAPSYLYDNELFWGQDRLDFLDQALTIKFS